MKFIEKIKNYFKKHKPPSTTVSSGLPRVEIDSALLIPKKETFFKRFVRKIKNWFKQ